MKSGRDHLQKIVTTAVFMALICVLTITVRIPTPTNGYINLGDCAVLLGGFLLGPVYGTVAGGVGSMLADMFAGYPVYMPATLIIKALMAWVVSVIPALLSRKNKKCRRIELMIGSIIAEMIMTAGYYLFEAVFLGEGFAAAFAGLSGNAMQGIVGITGFCFLAGIFHRTGIPLPFRNK